MIYGNGSVLVVLWEYIDNSEVVPTLIHGKKVSGKDLLFSLKGSLTSSPRISPIEIQWLRMSSPWVFCDPEKLYIPGLAKRISKLQQMLRVRVCSVLLQAFWLQSVTRIRWLLQTVEPHMWSSPWLPWMMTSLAPCCRRDSSGWSASSDLYWACNNTFMPSMTSDTQALLFGLPRLWH